MNHRAIRTVDAPLRVLIGCEFSGVVRRAFNRLGHEAWSCDLLPAEDGSNMHLVGDVRDYLTAENWDMVMVFHPPCTRLCNSGVRWLSVPPPGRTLDEMWAELDEAADLFNACWQAPALRVMVENPVMHGHARERIEGYVKPQIVQPHWFGERAFKATGLYLRGLEPLVPTAKLAVPKPGTAEHKRWSFIHLAGNRPDRWKLRPRTFEGIAEAMASQWGGLVDEEARA